VTDVVVVCVDCGNRCWRHLCVDCAREQAARHDQSHDVRVVAVPDGAELTRLIRRAAHG